MNILVTGCAGFIGMHASLKLLARGDTVLGVDSINNYYDPKLKENRLQQLLPHSNFKFVKLDISSREGMSKLFEENEFDYVLHLAAQAGVRYSVENPHDYAQSNLVGFLNVLEGCRHSRIKHLVYASSSSVYGGNVKTPFSESDAVDHPISFYAATKRSNELMAHSYSHLYQLPTTALRFFTAYGPWGRPDQSLFIFVKAILNNEPINIFNNGDMLRDFTYIDDIVEGITKAIDLAPTINIGLDQTLPNLSKAPFAIFNIGNGKSESLMDFITAIEKSLNKVAIKKYLPMQPGDVQATLSDTKNTMGTLNFIANTKIGNGVMNFVEWYLKFYHCK